jgi:hypothetical protein
MWHEALEECVMKKVDKKMSLPLERDYTGQWQQKSAPRRLLYEKHPGALLRYTDPVPGTPGIDVYCCVFSPVQQTHEGTPLIWWGW